MVLCERDNSRNEVSSFSRSSSFHRVSKAIDMAAMGTTNQKSNKSMLSCFDKLGGDCGAQFSSHQLLLAPFELFLHDDRRQPETRCINHEYSLPEPNTLLETATRRFRHKPVDRLPQATDRHKPKDQLIANAELSPMQRRELGTMDQ